MKIQVKQIFSRRRVMGSEKILPGVYDATDSVLFGLADELVELGFAEIVADDTPETVEPVVTPQPKMQGITHEEFERHTGRIPQAVAEDATTEESISTPVSRNKKRR